MRVILLIRKEVVWNIFGISIRHTTVTETEIRQEMLTHYFCCEEIRFLNPGNQTGTLTVVDDKGGITSEEWTVMVISRTFYIYWEEQKTVYSWSDYLEQETQYRLLMNQD